MKKNIIFFMPSFEGGGVEKNIIMTANNFVSKDVNVSLITASKKVRKKFNHKVNFISPKNHYWDKKSRSIKYVICIFFLFLKVFSDRNYYVFCFQGNIICTLFCKLFGLKIVIRPNSSPSGWSKNLLKRILFSTVLKLSDKIIVNSIDFKKELKNHFNLNSKCIYNPLNKSEILSLSKKKVNFSFFKKDHLNLISVGRLVNQKDHITTLKAINNIKNKLNLRLLIIGEGDKKNELIRFIKNNNLNKIVKIKNRMENPFPYILKSQIMILSSLYEGLPNILLEGIALKKFIISSNCPTGPKEILDSGKGGFLFKIKDDLELSQKILLFKKNYKLFLKKKNHSIKRLNRFNYEKNLNEYFNLFKNF